MNTSFIEMVKLDDTTIKWNLMDGKGFQAH